jgi:hypothetical protein
MTAGQHSLDENMRMHLIYTHQRTLASLAGRSYGELKDEHGTLTCPPAIGWCETCQDQRTGPHGAHPSQDVEASLYARQMAAQGIHPSQDRD